MRNYDRIMAQMSVERMAIIRTSENLGSLGETPHGFYNDAGCFNDYDDAIAAEIEWLQMDGDDK